MDQNTNAWATRRRWFYVIGIILFLSIYLLTKFWTNIFPAPTCFDNKQNNLERGIDCGGDCELVCKMDFIPLKNTFSKAFKNGENNYDILVILENNNKNMSPKEINVSIEIYNDKGVLENTLNNKIQASTYKKIPIYIKDYKTENGISKIFARFDTGENYMNNGAYDIRLSDFKYREDSVSKLNLTYTSPYKESIYEEIDLVILLKDSIDNIIGFNTQNIEGLYVAKESEIYFSWREKLGLELKSLEIIPVSYLFYK
jgi:hypothetical protein